MYTYIYVCMCVYVPMRKKHYVGCVCTESQVFTCPMWYIYILYMNTVSRIRIPLSWHQLITCQAYRIEVHFVYQESCNNYDSKELQFLQLCCYTKYNSFL